MVKFKMMGDLDTDLSHLRAIRACLPAGVRIQGDANCGYRDLDALLEALPLFEKAGLGLFEDPIAGPPEASRALIGKTSIRIISDQGARSLAHIRSILQSRSCDIINQHPCQQGGMARALAISRAAELMSLPTMVGGTGFLGVGTAAYQHLAAVIGLGFPCGELGGLYDHGFEDDIVLQPLPMKEGSIVLPDLPGTGIEIDEKSISKLVTDERRFSV